MIYEIKIDAKIKHELQKFINKVDYDEKFRKIEQGLYNEFLAELLKELLKDNCGVAKLL